MTIQEFTSTLPAELIQAVKTAVEKAEGHTRADAETLCNYIFSTAAPALGEDVVAEPFRYIASSVGGLRLQDLQALIGEDFDTALFTEFIQCLGFPIFVRRPIEGDELIALPSPQMHIDSQEIMGESSYKSCASDIGYYLMEQCDESDHVRRTQCLHLLIDGGEAAAAAEYVSAAEGFSLQVAIVTMGEGLKDGSDNVKDTILDMSLAEGERVDLTKILTLQLNDCIAVIGNPARQRPVIDHLRERIAQLLPTHPEISVLLGVAQLRTAQNERIMAARERQQKNDEAAQQHENGAQQNFIAALNYLMPALQNADPTTISRQQISQYWICLKICQEMGQPKAITLLFDEIVKVERAQIAALNPEIEKLAEGEAESTTAQTIDELTERIISQHIDMAKLYYQLPDALREQFTDYTDTTISLIDGYLKGIGDETREIPTAEEAAADPETLHMQSRLCSYWQALGELYQNKGQDSESYDALTETQIQMMRHVAALQIRDGKDSMSADQLMARLALSVTNHYLAGHFRKQKKSAHDLDVVLRANLDMAQDCFKHYPQDGRVIHFFINAALELGDNQHKTHSYMQELNSYKKVLQYAPQLSSLRLDQQLAQDVAMLFTKCGQLEATLPQPRIQDAANHLRSALGLWNSLAQNTGAENYRKNAEVCQQLLNQIGGKK